MKKELIFTDEKSNKFWNIEVNGSSFTVNYGKSGTDGTTQTKSFATDELCQKEANKLINEKLKKGYQEIGVNIIETTPKVSQKLIRKKDQKDYIDGYYTIDCAVRDKNIFYFVLRELTEEEDEYEVEKKIVNWLRERPIGRQWGETALSGVDLIHGACCTKPKSQFIGLTENMVYAMGSGDDDFEESISGLDDGGPFQGNPEKARNINGWLYATGGGHCVGKRVAKDEWLSFSNQIPNPPDTEDEIHMFHDIDGFSETDIYCVGDCGYVCHFNGNEWQMKTLPTNIDFDSVCCAGDGFVYIGGLHGATYKGRSDEWVCLYNGHLEEKPLSGMTLGFKDMVWYEDRVWCTSDYGIWTIKDDKLEVADVPNFVKGCAGNLSTADGVLLVAGYGGASFLENGEWKQIY